MYRLIRTFALVSNEPSLVSARGDLPSTKSIKAPLLSHLALVKFYGYFHKHCLYFINVSIF